MHRTRMVQTMELAQMILPAPSVEVAAGSRSLPTLVRPSGRPYESFGATL